MQHSAPWSSRACRRTCNTRVCKSATQRCCIVVSTLHGSTPGSGTPSGAAPTASVNRMPTTAIMATRLRLQIHAWLPADRPMQFCLGGTVAEENCCAATGVCRNRLFILCCWGKKCGINRGDMLLILTRHSMVFHAWILVPMRFPANAQALAEAVPC